MVCLLQFVVSHKLRPHFLVAPIYYLSAHMNRVTCIIFSLENEWLLSTGRDKYLQWHDCSTGKRLGGYQMEAWCTSLQYPLTNASMITVSLLFLLLNSVCWKPEIALKVTLKSYFLYPSDALFESQFETDGSCLK